MGPLLDSLDALRGQLADGLNYGTYLQEVRQLKSSYQRIPVERLGPGCVIAVGAPTEQALNGYLAAANVWGGCLETAGCTSESIAPRLSVMWRAAARPVSIAFHGLSAQHQ